MNKIEALQSIKEAWNDENITLQEKIVRISGDFYSVGLDVQTTASFINATPAELDALLSLGGLDDSIIELISKADPPKTTWALLANASDEEIKLALSTLSQRKKDDVISVFVYKQMLEISGPTPEQGVGTLTGNELYYIIKKGDDFSALSDWDKKFLRSIGAQRKQGKVLSFKQRKTLLEVLERLVAKGVVTRNSIDGDNDICDHILNVMGK